MVTVAAVQATPVFLDRRPPSAKSVRLIKEAAGTARADRVPGDVHPGLSRLGLAHSGVERRRVRERLYGTPSACPAPILEAIGRRPPRPTAYVVMGVNETRPGGARSTTRCSTSARTGRCCGKHRKLMPTGGERLVWGMGDGSTLQVVRHAVRPAGRPDLLGELHAAGALRRCTRRACDVYVAPTWDNSDMWVATLRHIAKEGRLYVIGVAPLLRGSDVPDDVPGQDELWGGDDDWMSRGLSTIVAPGGEILAGPLLERGGHPLRGDRPRAGARLAA